MIYMTEYDYIELCRFLLKEYDSMYRQLEDIDHKIYESRLNNDEKQLDELFLTRYKLRIKLFFYDDLQKRLFELLSYLLQIS